jgi:hypothetical protein
MVLLTESTMLQAIVSVSIQMEIESLRHGPVPLSSARVGTPDRRGVPTTEHVQV